MAQQGHFAGQQDQMRAYAPWVALLASTTSGVAFTPAQLLGEEPDEASVLAEAEKKLERLQREAAGG